MLFLSLIVFILFFYQVRSKEASRSEKWVKMIKQWNKYSDFAYKLRKRVYKGIPNSIRGDAWTKLMGVPQFKVKNEGYCLLYLYSFSIIFYLILIQVDIKSILNLDYSTLKIFVKLIWILIALLEII
jgi:predicted protein (fragment)